VAHNCANNDYSRYRYGERQSYDQRLSWSYHDTLLTAGCVRKYSFARHIIRFFCRGCCFERSSGSFSRQCQRRGTARSDLAITLSTGGNSSDEFLANARSVRALEQSTDDYTACCCIIPWFGSAYFHDVRLSSDVRLSRLISGLREIAGRYLEDADRAKL